MIRHRLWKQWKVTETHLEHAREMLPSPTAETEEDYHRLLADYRSFLERNELELALDMLEQLGELVPCRGGYWRNLERAAETMELQDRIPYFRQKFEQASKESP